MTFKNPLFISAIGLATVFTSCSGKKYNADNVVKTIVALEEPAFITSFKIKDMFDKGGISSKENIPSIAQMYAADKIDYLADPTKAGLDLTGKTYFGFSSDREGAHFWFVAKISDKAKFEKLLKDEGGPDKFVDVEGFTCIEADKNALLGWNEQVFIAVANPNGNAKDKFTKIVTSLKEDKKADAKFDKFFAKEADVTWFSNFSKIEDLQKNLPTRVNSAEQAAFSTLMSKLKGSNSLFTLNFENDKVVADVENDFTDGLKNELAFLTNSGLPNEMLSMVGSSNVDGFVSLNGDIQKFVEWISQMQGEKDVFADFKAETKLDGKRIVNSLKGNVLVSFIGAMSIDALTDFDEEGNPIMGKRLSPRMSTVISTKDNYIETIADSALKQTKTPQGYFVMQDKEKQYISFKPGYMFVTNDEEVVKNPQAAAPSFDAIAKKCLASPVGFYFDINKIAAPYVGEAPEVQKVTAKFKNAFGTLDLNGGHAELVLDNKGKNSLWTLINLGVQAGAGMMF